MDKEGHCIRVKWLNLQEDITVLTADRTGRRNK